MRGIHSFIHSFIRLLAEFWLERKKEAGRLPSGWLGLWYEYEYEDIGIFMRG